MERVNSFIVISQLVKTGSGKHQAIVIAYFVNQYWLWYKKNRKLKQIEGEQLGGACVRESINRLQSNGSWIRLASIAVFSFKLRIHKIERPIRKKIKWRIYVDCIWNRNDIDWSQVSKLLRRAADKIRIVNSHLTTRNHFPN